MRFRSFAAAMTLISASLAAHAATLNVNENGVFSATTPTTAYSAPGAVYSFSFNVSSTPVVSNVSTGNEFNAAVSNFTYTLNGITSTPTLGSFTPFSAAGGGLFDLCFNTACSGGLNPAPGFVFTGSQIYSGIETSPTILTGAYTLNNAYFISNGTLSALTLDSPVVISTPGGPTSSAPEISASGTSSCLVLLGGAILILREKKRFRTEALA